MKRFSFPLETALSVRRRRQDSEEALLAAIRRKQIAARERAEQLEREFADGGARIAGLQTTTGLNLQLGANHFDRLQRGRRVQQEIERKAEQEHQQQLLHAVEARRQVKLLETLRAKRWRAYLTELEREQEKEAAELFLAKWAHEK